jgi:glucose-6-phosphate 1-epimerase
MNGSSQQCAPSAWEGVHHFDQGKSEITVAQQGAHLLSWRVDGVEQLYLSPLASTDGITPIRGGVPVCFPQFNLRGSLPKHGFARTLPWVLVATAPHPCFELCSNANTRQLWPFDFVMRLSFELTDNSLRMVWSVGNTGVDSLSLTGALHTYLRVDAIEHAVLRGLQGQIQWDAVLDKSLTQRTTVGNTPLRFHSEFDRVYTAPPSNAPLRLEDGERAIHIAQSDSLAHTVVWNPHAALCRQIADLPDDGYQHYVCVEAAQVLSPITVPAGDTWTGWQALHVLT